MPNIKYLLLTRGFPPPFLGGSGRYLYNIFRFLAEDTIIFTEKSRAPGDPDQLPVRFIRRGYIYPFDSAQVPRVLRGLKKLRLLVFWAIELVFLCLRQRPQCVFIGQVHLVGMLGWFLKQVMGLPYIVFIYAEELTKASGNRQAIARTVCRHADAIITISRFSLELVSEMGIERERIILAPPGIDVNSFEIRDRQVLADFRAKLAPHDHKILLTVGRLAKRKGHAEVISVLPGILKQVPKLRYVIAGADVGEEDSLKTLAKRLNVEEHVVFLGRIPEDDISLLYNACDVFVMANYEPTNKDTEGFGIVFLEANAAHKPVIGGRAGGVTDAIADGISGLLVAVTNPDELATAILRLLQDKAYANQLAEQGYERVTSLYSWDHTATIIQECAEQIING